jgi:hypothetical protein
MTIASCGRKFFRRGDDVSRFDVTDSGRVYFWDKYTHRQIPTWSRAGSKTWQRYFSEGGTLKSLVREIGIDYIAHGKPLPAFHFGPWPDWYSDGDPWAYGIEPMRSVRDKALALGIVLVTAAVHSQTGGAAADSSEVTA